MRNRSVTSDNASEWATASDDADDEADNVDDADKNSECLTVVEW